MVATTGLRRENGAALGAARSDHAAAALGTHAGAKAVIAFATDNGRLECTFHGSLWASCGLAVSSGQPERQSDGRWAESPMLEKPLTKPLMNLRKSLEL